MALESRRLVLVVDDDDAVRELLSMTIADQGYGVESAADGEEGLRKAHSLKPELIILDLMMPRSGGFEILRRFQGTELARVPVVIMTGRQVEKSTIELIREESNVVEVLQKPLDQEKFLGVLNRILRSPGFGMPV